MDDVSCLTVVVSDVVMRTVTTPLNAHLMTTKLSERQNSDDVLVHSLRLSVLETASSLKSLLSQAKAGMLPLP